MKSLEVIKYLILIRLAEVFSTLAPVFLKKMLTRKFVKWVFTSA